MRKIMNTYGMEEPENVTLVVNLCSLIGMNFDSTGNMTLLLDIINGIIDLLETD